MLDLLCPVCGETLVREERVWHCKNRHSFDVARSGYVNLLPPSASGKRHGDDKHMVAARTAFLSRGYYDHLIGAVAEACMQLAGPDACVLDAGCGEGTYTRAIYDALAAKGGRPQLLGADISAEAVKRAARQVPEGIFCVATTARLPLAAESLDLIVNFILFVDESHVTLPQVRAMYNGDHARKKSLVDYGFRLPSAYDNRPLTFDEFTERIHQAIYVSATPAEYERSRAGQIAEQVIRPTGLLDPEVFVRPIEGQIDDLIGEINATTDKGERTLVTTLTKKI